MSIEQNLLCAFDDDGINTLDLVCTGFRPDDAAECTADAKYTMSGCCSRERCTSSTTTEAIRKSAPARPT